MEYEERHFTAIREKNGELRKYENHEKIDFVIDEDILGFDANVLVDLASSEDFRNEIKAEVKFNVVKNHGSKTHGMFMPFC